jgi:hypothetical protein
VIRVDFPDRGRYAVLVGGGILIRIRRKSHARRLWGQNEPRNPYVVRRVLRWRRDKEYAGG